MHIANVNKEIKLRGVANTQMEEIKWNSKEYPAWQKRGKM